MPVDSIPVQWTLRGAIIRLPDEIDATNSEQVRTALDDALNTAPAVLVADMTRTTYCCSEGLRALLKAHQAAQRAGILMRIAGVHTRVRRILTVTGANQILEVHPTTESAMTGQKTG